MSVRRVLVSGPDRKKKRGSLKYATSIGCFAYMCMLSDRCPVPVSFGTVDTMHAMLYVCTQVYVLGRGTSTVVLLQLKSEGGAVDYKEAYSAVSPSLNNVFVVRGERVQCCSTTRCMLTDSHEEYAYRFP